MAVIKKKLIRFKRLSDFESRLAKSEILASSIVFIEDAKCIWTQNSYYYCPETIDWSKIDNKPTDLKTLGITDVYTKDESDSLYLEVEGVAVAAQKWENPVTIAIDGAVTGEVQIDGSGDVTITTEVSHEHSQYENQNAFATVEVDNKSINADSTQDSVQLISGDNVTLSVSGSTITIDAEDTTYEEATIASAGLMSASDKEKLNDIEAGAQVNTITGVKGDSESTYRTGNVNITKANIGLGNVDNLSKASILASAALTGTPTAPTAAASTNTTQIATTAFVQSEIAAKIAAAEAMRFKGTVGTGGTVTSLPASHKVGDTYKVLIAGTYAGVNCEVGDMIICTTSGSSSNNAHWAVIQANIDGAVTGPASSTNAHVAIFNGATGKMIKDSGFTIGKSVPADAVFTDTTYSVATTTAAGLMSTTDKSKLDGIAAGANNYVHPTHSAKTSGLYKITVDNLGHVTAASVVEKADIVALGIPSSDTTYSAVTTTKNGLMIASDKSKLDGIAAGATANTGTVTKVTAGAGLTGGDITTTGTIALATSGVTAGSAGPTAAANGTTTTVATVAIPRITVDTYGRVTALTSYNLTVKDTTYSAASTTAAGLMSATDKTNLDRLVSKTLVEGNGTVTNVVSLTQAQYDALSSKSATTLYVVTD